MRKTNKSILLIFALLIAVVLSLSAVSAEDVAIDGDIASVDDSISDVSSEDLSIAGESPIETIDTASEVSTSTDDSTLGEGDSSSWYVDSKVETTGDGSQASPFKTIGEAFNASQGNGTIYLASGVYNTTDDKSFKLNNGQTLSIIGADNDETIIDMLRQSQYFFLTSSNTTLYLSNIKFVNYYGSSAPVRGYNLNIENCVFSNCYSTSWAPAIYLSGGQSLIKDSVFVNNSGSSRGGAIHIETTGREGYSNIVIENCLFKNDTNNNGAAIYIDNTDLNYGGADVLINNCNFTECPQTIYSVYGIGNLVVNNSYFYNNNLNATNYNVKQAGCFYLGGSGNLTIDSTKFENNTGGQYAVLVSTSNSNGVNLNLTIVNSEFNNNFVGYNSYTDACIGFNPRSGGSLYLNNNTGSFGNHSFVSILEPISGGNSSILSDLNIVVLDNATYDLNTMQFNIIGTLTDDMGNPINMTGFDLYFNDVLVGSKLTFKSGVNDYSFKEALNGSYLVKYVYNGNNVDLTSLNVKTSIINVVPLESVDVYVATDGSDETGDGTEANPFATIEKALDTAATALNANVYIKPGTYNYRTFKNIDTANGILNILAIDGDVTVDMGGQSRFCNVSNRSNVLIQGIYFINGYQSSGRTEDYGIINSHGNLTVKECKFANNSGYQSTIFGDSVIDSCIFESNSYNKIELYEVRTVINCTFYGASNGGYAISFYDNYNHPYNLTVENCKFYDNSQVYSSGNVTIKSSEFLNLTKYAIETQGGSLTVDDCTFKDLSNSAIYLGYGSQIVNIRNSKLINVTSQYPINAYRASELYLENNTVSDINNPYVFVDNNAYLLSPTTILVLNNETIEQESFGANLKAKILDDNGNTISLRRFTFEFDGKNITGSLSYDEMVAKTIGLYNGTYLVSGSSTNLLDATVKTGVLIITPLMNKDLYVSTTGSDETGDGTEANPFATVQKAMGEAIAYNNTIHVADGVYNIAQSLKIDTNTAIVNIVGEGENTVFNMNNGGSFISSLSSNSIVKLENLTLANGYNAYGGFIKNSGNLTIEGVNFINSTAYDEDWEEGDGGAIYNSGYLYVLNSNFVNNNVPEGSGGAIYSSKYVYVKNNTFTDCTAWRGNYIFTKGIVDGPVILTVMDNASWDISSSSVTFNATVTDDNGYPITASGSNAGFMVTFYLDGTKLVTAYLQDGVVKSNAVNLKLNGQHVLSATFGSSEEVVVKNATLNFVNPDVLHDVYISAEGDDDTGDGTQANPYASLTKAVSVIESINGVIHVMSNYSNMPTFTFNNLYNLTIIGETDDINFADKTNALFGLNSGSLNIVNIKFSNNKNTNQLISAQPGTILTLINCTYENNILPNNLWTSSFINCICDELYLINCKLINNVLNVSSFSDGNLIMGATSTSLINCTIANNNYTNTNGALGGSLICLRNAEKYVGGSYVNCIENQLFENCIFENNTGLLIQLESASVFDNCSFTNNNGTLMTMLRGQEFYSNMFNTEIKNSAFENNNGSYLINSGIGNLTIENTNITSNNASNLIFVSGQGVNVNNNIIKDNTGDAFIKASGTALVNIHDNELELGDMTYVNLTGNSKITGSTFTLTVNDNGTYEIEGLNLAFNASLVDADGNIIYGPMVYFTLNGDDIISANLVPVAIANAKFGGEGEFIASARTNAIYDPNELTVKTSVFNIRQIQEKIIYVDVLGNDETGDGSEENPYASLERAIQDAGGLNNIIYIQPGVYENMALGSQFTLIDDQKLSIIGLSNEVDKVVIKGLDKTFADIVYTYGKFSDDQFVIKNIEFVNATISSSFIRTNYVNNVLLENVVFDNINANYLIEGDSNNLEIINSTINGVTSSIMIYAENVTVLDSVLTNNSANRVFQIANRNAGFITISNSAIVSNKATQRFIYEQWSSTKTLENNWWGNNTNADELRTLTGVDIANWIVAEVTANDSGIQIGDTVKFDLVLKLNDGSDLTDILPTRIVKAIADNTAFDPESVEVVNNEATITGTVSGTGDITISIDNQDFVFDVKGYNAYITVDNVAIKLGETATVTVTFTDDNGPLANKELAVKVNGEESTVTTDADGKATITLADLAKGNHIVEVNFAGDNMHDPVTGAGLVMVSDAVLTVNIPEVSYGESPTINVELKDTEGNPLSGLVTVNINGKDYNVLVKDGEGSLAVPDKFDAGEYTVSAKLIGDSITESTATFVVDKLASAMTVTVADVAYGEPFVINLDIADKTISGLSIVNINGIDYAIDIVDGVASKTIDLILDGGSYDVTAKFIGDNYNIPDAAATFNVNPSSNTQLDAEIDDHSLVITLTDESGNGISGAVNVTIDGVTTEVPIVNGRASVDIPDGEHSVAVEFTGDANNGPASISKDVNVESKTLPTEVKVTVSNVTYGEAAAIEFNVTDKNGNPISGVLNVSINDIIKEVTVTGGSASISLDDLASGNYAVIANYIANGNYEESTGAGIFNVAKIETSIDYKDMTTTAVERSIEGNVGKYFTITLKDSNGKALANKAIQIGFNGKIYKRTTDQNGKASLQVNLPTAGFYTFAVTFLGDENCTGTFVAAKITVNKQKGSLTVPAKSYKESAKTKTLTATFKTASGKLLKDKKITFTVNGKTYTAKTDAKGVATVNVSLSKKGTYKFTAKFAGDITYAALSKTATLTIK